MYKDDVVKELINKGFDAVNSSGVVIVRYSSGMYADFRTNVGSVLRDLGYRGSWGLASTGSVAKEHFSADIEAASAEASLDASDDMCGITIDTETGQLVFA